MIFNKQTLINLQDRVYELEGLLQLAIDRDPCPEGIKKLIVSKIQEITEASDSSQSTKIPEPTEEIHQSLIPEPTEEIHQARIPQPTEEIPQVRIPEPVNKPATSQERGKPRFCLNDRFRFTRELFGGDSKLFNQTIDLIADMKSFEEAEEYFSTRFNWDPEDETTQYFQEIIKVYFE